MIGECGGGDKAVPPILSFTRGKFSNFGGGGTKPRSPAIRGGEEKHRARFFVEIIKFPVIKAPKHKSIYNTLVRRVMTISL